MLRQDRDNHEMQLSGEGKMGIRYSFDIGTNSIGWAVWRTGPDPKLIFGEDAPLELLGAGVRLFKDGRNPKDGQSLAAMRRVPKQARKRRDRFVLRRADLMAALVEAGLMAEDEDERKALANLDPYQLRAKGLDEALTPHEFGRALFHLHQRRGFRSNRKADRKTNDKDKGKIAAAAAKLRETLEKTNSRTLGEYLWSRHRGSGHDPKRARDPGRQATRIRLEGQGAQALYEFYPTRDMLRHEFETLWDAQTQHHPALLTPQTQDEIGAIIFRQRELKPPKIGLCTFEYGNGEERLPKALPSVQAREIYERLGHLRLSTGPGKDRPLMPEERDALATVLFNKDKMTFLQIRKALKLGGEVKLNSEEMGEKEFLGLRTSRMLLQDDHYGPGWRALSWAGKDAFVAKLLDAVDDERLIARLMAEDGLSRVQAENCALIPLPDGYSRLGKTANAAILEALIEERDENDFVVTYDKAVRRAGEKLGRNWHHSDERDGELLDRLPYYGKVLQRYVLPGTFDPADRKDEAKFWGRIMNPSVHIGLNQLRRVVNALIAEYGEPDQIVVELARELKMSEEQKRREAERNRDNRAANDKRAKKLEELGQPNTGENRARLKLYEEQQTAGNGVAHCPFSLKPIAISQLFSPEIEIEHLLPRSLTLDDTAANKVLCFRDMNRIKRGNTPWQAFHASERWDDILALADKLPHNKRWRFREDALERFEASAAGKVDRRTLEEMGLTNGFQARHLNETKHMSRLAKAYLGKICDPDRIYVTPGTLTGLLRGKWGLNSLLSDDNRKDRTDHRHHAIDAITIGAMTRSLLLHLNTEAGRAEQSEYEQVLGRVPWPFDNFRDAVRAKLETLVVSNKPEHGKTGALHEDTAYGLVEDRNEAKEIGNLVRRKPLVDLTPGEVDRIRDANLRKAVQAAVAPYRDNKGKVADKNGYAAALAEIGANHGVRRVRVGKVMSDFVQIADSCGRTYKTMLFGENRHADVIALKDGRWELRWASVFEVSRKDWRPDWEQEKIGAKLVMRLHKGDCIEIDSADGSRRKLLVIHQLDAGNGRLFAAEPKEGGGLERRRKDKDDPFEWVQLRASALQRVKAISVRVDELGRAIPRRTNV